MELKKVMVIGAGQMGSGIAQVMAAHGVEVVLRDIKQEFVDRGIKNIEKNLTRSVEKGRITEDEKKATLGRITGVVEMTKETCNVHLAIEAATENVKIKKDIFQTLDELCPEDAIIASNTSSVSITMLGGFTKRADKFIGMHFFNPAPVMKLVEVTRGLATSDDTFKKVYDLAAALDKTPVAVKDSAGFVGNRIRSLC
jgi:3-hydroxybutyryl-CoA dehydrogenase